MAQLERDHPRSRGEHNAGLSAAHIREGSSPLTRGAPAGIPRRRPCERIIPAHAGSTSTGVGCGVRASDHPRSRGEHVKRLGEDGLLHGSSPLTRGAQLRHGGRLNTCRIIPAHAGSTNRVNRVLTDPLGSSPLTRGAHTRRYKAVYGGDHPRSRGEHRTPIRCIQGVRGSSPLTRGAPSPNQ